MRELNLPLLNMILEHCFEMSKQKFSELNTVHQIFHPISQCFPDIGTYVGVRIRFVMNGEKYTPFPQWQQNLFGIATF